MTTWNLPRGYIAKSDGTWWTLYAGGFGCLIHTTDPEAFRAYLIKRGLAS